MNLCEMMVMQQNIPEVRIPVEGPVPFSRTARWWPRRMPLDLAVTSRLSVLLLLVLLSLSEVAAVRGVLLAVILLHRWPLCLRRW